MFMVETDYDVPGYQENAQYTDQELWDMEEERLRLAELEAQEAHRAEMDRELARDLPYMDYGIALQHFLEVAELAQLRAARAQIDTAILAYLVKARDMAEAAVELRAETKTVMREFKIPDPERKPRDDAGKKRK